MVTHRIDFRTVEEEQAEPVIRGTSADRQGKGKPIRRLRVAFIAGAVGQRGAEKQLVYMACALRRSGADVRLYTLKKEVGFYGPLLHEHGLKPCWVGMGGNPLVRLATITARLWEFKPHIVQATHFYTNLYVALAGRVVGAIPIGCSRNDVFSEVGESRFWGRWSLRLPPALMVNSHAAKRNALSFHIKPDDVHVIANVIDLEDFDARKAKPLPALAGPAQVVAMAVGRLFPQKRFDRFLIALARARTVAPHLKGVIVGDGPLGPDLEVKASSLGLGPDNLTFLGRRDDVPALLRQAHMVVLTSDHEGFPNVLLEGMAARLPVITTPAGEADVLVRHGRTGYVVPFDNLDQMAACMIRLSQSPALCQQFGEAGRIRVEEEFSSGRLAGRLHSIYRQIALRQHRKEMLRLVPDQPASADAFDPTRSHYRDALHIESAGTENIANCPARFGSPLESLAPELFMGGQFDRYQENGK